LKRKREVAEQKTFCLADLDFNDQKNPFYIIEEGKFGWSWEMIQQTISSENDAEMAVEKTKEEKLKVKKQLQSELNRIYEQIQSYRYSWPFKKPVDTDIVTDYLDVIKCPIDLTKIKQKIDQKSYQSKNEMQKDVELMCKNCKNYNSSASEYFKAAEYLLKYSKRIFRS